MQAPYADLLAGLKKDFGANAKAAEGIRSSEEL